MSTDARVETIRLLRSIDASLQGIFAIMAKQHTSKTPSVDLDSKHGDPIVNQKDPRDWTSESMKGRHFSECPPEYLDMIADRLDYFASKETDEKKRGYNVLDAARARGWAARLRSGWTAPVTAPLDESQTEPQW